MSSAERGKFFEEPLNRWIRESLKNQPSTNGTKLAEEVGVSKMQISNWSRGTHNVPAKHVPALARALKSEPPLFGFGFYAAPVIGVINATKSGWAEAQPVTRHIPVSPNWDMPDAEYVAFTVECGSMADMYKPGDTIVCYKYSEKMFVLQTGQQVVIERNKLGVRQISMRIFEQLPDKQVFRTLDPSIEDVVIHTNSRKKTGDEKVTVLGIYYEMTRKGQNLS